VGPTYTFGASVTRGDAWAGEGPWASLGFTAGYYWDLTYSGPWPTSFYNLVTSSPVGNGVGCAVGDGIGGFGSDLEPRFNLSCPVGGCEKTIRRIYLCTCGTKARLTFAPNPSKEVGWSPPTLIVDFTTVCP
jgi:hypothetical protein